MCINCEESFPNEEELKIHIQNKHSSKCKDCGETFVNKTKFKTHTCRLHIINPASGHLYMKNWYIKDSCISVFSERENKEVLVLHSSHCVNRKHCSVVPPSLKHSVHVVDKDGLTHLNAFCVLKSGEVHWDLISGI